MEFQVDDHELGHSAILATDVIPGPLALDPRRAVVASYWRGRSRSGKRSFHCYPSRSPRGCNSLLCWRFDRIQGWSTRVGPSRSWTRRPWCC